MSFQKKPVTGMVNTKYWDENHGCIHTDRGGWIIGDRVYNQGYSVLEDLVGKASYFQVLVLNATGIFPERRLADWLEALFICLSWPDSRIWCNQIGSLAGTMRTSPVAAVSAGILASDSRMYGPGSIKAGVSFIIKAMAQKNNGQSARAIVNAFPRKNTHGVPVIPGYIRPIASGDERVTAMEKVNERLQFNRGRFLSLAFEIDAAMSALYSEGINLMGYTVAFLLDHSFDSKQMYRLFSTCVHSGVHSCFAEAAENPAEGFFPLHCKDIDYQGQTARSVPPRSLK